MKGQSKQEISQVKKEMEKTYNEMLEGIKEKVIYIYIYIMFTSYISYIERLHIITMCWVLLSLVRSLTN